MGMRPHVSHTTSAAAACRSADAGRVLDDCSALPDWGLRGIVHAGIAFTPIAGKQPNDYCRGHVKHAGHGAVQRAFHLHQKLHCSIVFILNLSRCHWAAPVMLCRRCTTCRHGLSLFLTPRASIGFEVLWCGTPSAKFVLEGDSHGYFAVHCHPSGYINSRRPMQGGRDRLGTHGLCG
jgi:hypothetical protein